MSNFYFPRKNYYMNVPQTPTILLLIGNKAKRVKSIWASKKR